MTSSLLNTVVTLAVATFAVVGVELFGWVALVKMAAVFVAIIVVMTAYLIWSGRAGRPESNGGVS